MHPQNGTAGEGREEVSEIEEEAVVFLWVMNR